jgi:hypothetical protein
MPRYLNNTANVALVPAAALPCIRVLPQLVAKLEKQPRRQKRKTPVLSGFLFSCAGAQPHVDNWVYGAD